MTTISKGSLDRVMGTLSLTGRPAADPVADLTLCFDERITRMNDGTMAIKTAKLRAMTNQVPNPPIAGASF